MATITPTLKTGYQSKDGTFPVIVRVIHNRKVKNINTGYKVAPEYFVDGKVSKKHPDALFINNKISTIMQECSMYLAECEIYGKPIRLENIGTPEKKNSFIAYLKKRAENYNQKKQHTMRRKVDRLALELEIVNGSENLFFDEITPSFIRDYEAYLIGRKNNPNTRIKKISTFSDFFNNAINEGLTNSKNHFSDYKIQSAEVKKERLTDLELTDLENIELPPGPVNDARNMWLFSYYSRGTRFANVVTLKKMQIADRVFIKMNKGENKHISLPIHERLQRIIDLYQDSPSEYLFPFIKKPLPDPDTDAYNKRMDSLNVLVNRYLKVAIFLAGIRKHITFHCARHTFASHLERSSKDIKAVQQALGHSDIATTERYLRSLDETIVDNELTKLYNRS